MQPKTAPTILLTRPKDGAERFAEALRQDFGANQQIVLSPLTRIEWIEEEPDTEDITRLVFTSINGVRAFVRQSKRRDIACYTVGDATAREAQSFGLRATSCKGRASDLIARILADGERGPVLHVRGEHSRGAVVENLRAGGCEAREIIFYRQVEQALSQEAMQLIGENTLVIVPLFSPRGAALFVEQYQGPAQLIVVAISAEVAKVAAKLHPKQIVIAVAPNAKSMRAAIKGLLVAD